MGSIKDEDEEDEDDTGDDYSDDEGGSNGGLSRKQRKCLVLGLRDIVFGAFPQCKCHHISHGPSCQGAREGQRSRKAQVSMSSILCVPRVDSSLHEQHASRPTVVGSTAGARLSNEIPVWYSCSVPACLAGAGA